MYNKGKQGKTTMNNPKRTILIGFIVGLLFFGWWFRGFLYINWRFGLFSLDSWIFLFREIGAGWRVSSKGDWIFLISFVLSFPLYLTLWYWANKIKWENLFGKTKNVKLKLKKNNIQSSNTRQKKEEKTISPQKAPPIASQRPVAMPSFGPTMRTKPIQKDQPFQSEVPFTPQASTESQPFSENPLSSTSSETPDISSWESLDPDFNKVANTPLSEIQLPQNQSVDENINDILTNNGWRHLSNIVIDKHKIDIAISQEEIALLVFDDESGDWLADEEAFNDEDPLWFSETDHRTSPVFNLGVLAKKFSQKLADNTYKIQPILVERKGNLINAEDMLKTWNDLGIIVCRTAIGGPIQLKTFSEVFNKPTQQIKDSDLEKIKQILS